MRSPSLAPPSTPSDHHRIPTTLPTATWFYYNQNAQELTLLYIYLFALSGPPSTTINWRILVHLCQIPWFFPAMTRLCFIVCWYIAWWINSLHLFDEMHLREKNICVGKDQLFNPWSWFSSSTFHITSIIRWFL